MEQKKWALVDWNMLCRSKMDGGLILKDPHINNKIGNAKIWWHWVTHINKPWAMVWKIKYAPNYSKPDLIRFSGDPKGSHIWNSATTNRNIVQTFNF